MSKGTIAGALDALSRGAVVAAATESSFGLLASLNDPRALATLAQLKPRTGLKGTGIILPDRAVWGSVAQVVTPLARALADALWPGPLSIVLPATLSVNSALLLNGTLSARVPGPCSAATIVQAFGVPLTATSANLPGEPPLNDDASVTQVFHEHVQSGALYVVAGKSPGGPPSTLVACGSDRPEILREGAIAGEVIFALLGSAPGA